MNIQVVADEIQGFDEHQFVGPIQERLVAQAEKELEVTFPPEYRQFLLTLGSGSVSSESFIGMGGAKHLDIVWMTRALRQKKTERPFPTDLLPVRTDGFGNYDCVDMSHPTASGEYAIVEWLHDAGGQKGKVLAMGYFEWFLAILQMIRDLEVR